MPASSHTITPTRPEFDDLAKDKAKAAEILAQCEGKPIRRLTEADHARADAARRSSWR